MRQCSQTGVWLILVVVNLCSGCGGSGGSGSVQSPPPTQPVNPVPTISSISPNSSKQGGPAFTLSVVGSNFLNSSTVTWNGSRLPTTFVNPNLITADVAASALRAKMSNAIGVDNPSLGGGSSNSLSFAVPCVIAPIGAAASQTRARLGAYYFDGWSGPLTHTHFQNMPLGPYQDREPITGWQDNSVCAVEQQLALAHNAGVDFFVYDWYFNPSVNDPGENLNSALQITHSLSDHHGMQYAILYVPGAPFTVGPSNWTAAINEWLTYMTDPDYLRVQGKPVLFVLNVGEVRQEFGSASADIAALKQLRTAAQAKGLPDVYIVGGFGVPDGTQGQHSLTSGFALAQEDGYDAIAFYGYPFAPPASNGPLLFSQLSAAGHWIWDEAASSSPLPFIPTAMSGWDPRPWDERQPSSGDLMYYSRTPQEVANFVAEAINWANTHPALRPEVSPAPPLVLIEAWNELGEGSHIVPTTGEGSTYTDALATTLQGP